jgi:excisionase family DNA binding protein
MMEGPNNPFVIVSEIWTADEVAAYTKIPRSTVETFARDGRIPSFKLGRHRRYKRTAIEAWVTEQAGS